MLYDRDRIFRESPPLRGGVRGGVGSHADGLRLASHFSFLSGQQFRRIAASRLQRNPHPQPLPARGRGVLASALLAKGESS